MELRSRVSLIMLSRYSDAWFMSESLAFYLSTNTFNNPVFDEQLAADLCLDQRQPSSREKVDKLESRLGARCSQLCDSLVFSLKSKIFVLELNFKRSLRRLRSFADRQRLRLVPGSSAWSASSQWARRKRVGDRAGVEQTPWMHRTLSSADESKFWRKMDDSRAPLDAQKERILSRLEQVVQAKRMSEQNAHLKLNHLQLIRQSRVSHASDISDKESAPKEDPAVACQLGKQTNECATNTNGAHQSGSATPTLPLLPGRRVTKQGWQSGWRLKVSLASRGPVVPIGMLISDPRSIWRLDTRSLSPMSPPGQAPLPLGWLDSRATFSRPSFRSLDLS